jgi:hypothetical protein
MIFKAINFKAVKNLRWVGLACFFLQFLTACPGTDDNQQTEGLTVHWGETHYSAVENSSQPAPASGGYAQAQLEHHDIRDQNGIQLSVYRAYLVINQLELVPCTSIAQQPYKHFDASFAQTVFSFLKPGLHFFIPNAFAHAGHGIEPVGNRGLDKPNVIDITTQDQFTLALGDAPIAAGRYCDIKVSLVRLSQDAYGKPDPIAASQNDPITTPEIPDMSGRMFSLRADYCATREEDDCLHRERVDIDDTGLSEPLTETIALKSPIEISRTLDEIYIIVGIDYSQWLENIDIKQLSQSHTERQKLAQNIYRSFHVYGQGLGELP